MPLMPGVDFEEIWNALDAAFDDQSLRQMLRTRVGPQPVKQLAWTKASRDICFDLLQLAEREGWHVRLVCEAHRFVPGNAMLAHVYQQYGLQPEVDLQHAGAKAAPGIVVGSVGTLEKTVNNRLPMLDPEVWRAKFSAAENWVCRVERDGAALGTGFLVSSDRVLTNHHVVAALLNGETQPERIRFRFGYKQLADGARELGRLVALHATDWRGPSSPCTPEEEAGNPDGSLPTDQQLDFAVLRLAEPVGTQPVAADAPAGAPARQWLELPAAAPDLHPGDPLLILQHPDGAPLKLAMDLEAVLGSNSNGTRIRYATNTAPGSSGSPCFTLDWTPVALHHCGDPAYSGAKYNQGVPFRLIRSMLQ
ncbi:MAG: trypsin-like peptidase domain-containing protein [Planctomycetaceae bacterium]